MAGLVSPDAFYNFFHGGIFRQLVVVSYLFFNRESSPTFKHAVWTIHVFKHAGVCPHSLLLHIADEAMREFGID